MSFLKALNNIRSAERGGTVDLGDTVLQYNANGQKTQTLTREQAYQQGLVSSPASSFEPSDKYPVASKIYNSRLLHDLVNNLPKPLGAAVSAASGVVIGTVAGVEGALNGLDNLISGKFLRDP